MLKYAIILAALCLPSLAQELPDAPSPQPTPQAHFFTFRKSWQDPPLRTNKQVFKSKVFIGLHVAGLAAFLIDHHVTHGAREDYGSELPAIAALTGMDYLSDRLFTEAFSVEAPIYEIIHYSRDATK